MTAFEDVSPGTIAAMRVLFYEMPTSENVSRETKKIGRADLFIITKVFLKFVSNFLDIVMGLDVLF
jgi:hypothetical protein